MNRNYVAYFRVSTSKQGKSGLGLDGQKSMVVNFLNSNQGVLLKEYTEIETGTGKRQRTEIFNAITFAKQQNAILVIAKLDRLARNVHFITSLKEAGVEFVCCDMPFANNLTILIMSAIAEEEAKMISSRTKLALAEKKKRGFKLGKPENLTNEHRKKGGEAMRLKSLNNKVNQQANALVVEYRTKGMSYDKIAEQLTRLNFRTANEKNFSSSAVMRLYKRYISNELKMVA